MLNKFVTFIPLFIIVSVVVFVSYRFIEDRATASTPTPTEATKIAVMPPTDTPSPTNTPTPTDIPTKTPTPIPTATHPPESPTVTPIPPTDTPSPTATLDVAATAAANETATAVAGETATFEANQAATATVAEAATAETVATETAIAAASTTAAFNATATAEAVPPTPIPPPTPVSEAVVVAATGVELRSGPGENYDVVSVIQKAAPLDILRRVVDKDEWMKVSVDSGAEIIEGYAPVSPDIVAINIRNWDEIPAIYEYGPRLLEPIRFASYPVDGAREFTWDPVAYPLEEYQFYSVILVRDDLSDGEACYHWQTKDLAISFNPKDHGCTSGAYHWGVGLATDLAQGIGDRDWRDDSERDERNPIGLDIPHPDTPEGGGDSGGGGGGGSSGSGRTGGLPPP